MPKASTILYYLVHIQELRSMIQWKVWHNPVHERNEEKESANLKRCFHYLDLTSRSFSAVIKELHPDLLVPICLFYLVLRGLDTVEDDVSINIKEKEPLLRTFQDKLEVDGWNYTGNRPEEKDRDLLVNFQVVIEEYKKQKPEYQEVIKDICNKMGNGMADYCLNAEFNNEGVKSVGDYDLYCHYVAGLVGEGLTRMFVQSGFGNPRLMDRPNLANSMGLFLQKTNIIRDVREDHDDDRHFWPKEIWSKHVDEFGDLFKPQNKVAALACQSEMILNALNHADECLFYLAGLREQSVFNFCAIPQTMAIATLDLCFQNYAMIERNIKISKGQACQIMIESTQNLQMVCERFRKHIRSIRKKNNPRDPSFLKISIACGKVEQFIESIFPQQTPESLAAEKDGANQRVAQGSRGAEGDGMSSKETFYLVLAVGATLLFVSGMMILMAWLAGARFDLAVGGITEGIAEIKAKLFPPSDPAAVRAAKAITSSIAEATASIKKEL